MFSDCIIYILDDIPEPLKVTKLIAVDVLW